MRISIRGFFKGAICLNSSLINKNTCDRKKLPRVSFNNHDVLEMTYLMCEHSSRC